MREIGLYIHIPFCIKKCNYCDFNSYETLGLISSYMEALKREIKSYKDKEYTIKTVFIGGGTPTLLEAREIYSLAECIYSNFKVLPDAEITIEANPGTLSREKLTWIKSAGVNRLSLGLQAYQDGLLRKLGRIHTVQEFEDNFFTARKIGFDNISVDIMFGLPGQTLKDYYLTLKNLLILAPEHISAYSLSIEEGTSFFNWWKQGKLILPSEEEERAMYHGGRAFLTSHGFVHYEISNFSAPGRESKHNMIYWIGEEYLGLGAGAHSYIEGERFYNYPKIKDYIEHVENGLKSVAHRQILSPEDILAEYCFLGLRLIDGICKEDFKRRFGRDINFIYGEAIAKLKEQGLLQENTRNLKLTTKGLDFANNVFMEFLP